MALIQPFSIRFAGPRHSAILTRANRRGAGAGEDARVVVIRIVVGLAAIIESGRPLSLGSIVCSSRGKIARLACLEYSFRFSFPLLALSRITSPERLVFDETDSCRE